MSKETKPFLGGAEAARRNARRKQKATRILRPGETLRPHDYLNKKMPSMERFFASLLKSPASDFVNNSQEGRNRLIGDVCRRLGLAPPSTLQPEYKDACAHFECRAALVMEESRHVVSEALSSLWRGRGSNNGIRVSFKSMETKKEPGHLVFCFEKKTPFTPRELYDIRPGGCFEILRPGQTSVEHSLLACVVSSGRDFDDHTYQTKILLMVFAPFGELPKSGQWTIRPVAAMISNLRQFEACVNCQRVPFVHALLGRKGSTHTRFRNDENSNEEDSGSDEDEKKQDDDEEIATDSVFTLPTLNRTQEDAAHTFLRSSPGSITVIQGPPGTGKTTLLVSIICRYLMESATRGVQRRLMVCAPTNKAVTVLVTRYLESINCVNRDPFNVVLIGEQDKLLNEERSLLASHETTCPIFRIRNIFAYTWQQGVADDCKYIQHKLKSGHAELVDMTNRILVLCSRIKNSLTILDQSLVGLMDQILESANSATNSDLPVACYCEQWSKLLKQLASEIILLDPSVVVRELMESAQVIFCTLASAGNSIVKHSSAIDDLIVDEAAAATEPELYIPFHLNPSRLLAVGDPMQLPACVLSRSAERFGLAKSLHERLMYDLGCDHIMLDVQYRMRPEISEFPSGRFYGGKIANGENVTSASYKNTVSLLNDNPYVFIQVTGTERQAFGGSFQNADEAEAVVELVRRLHRDETDWCSAEKIRIITFYQAQVSLLKRKLSERGLCEVVVATVDSSQGCEADVVIVSFVRSIGGSRGGNHSAGFLSDDRRLNVALTRAKYQLICVGNGEGFKNLPETSTLKALSQDATCRDCICPQMLLGLYGKKTRHDNSSNKDKTEGKKKKKRGSRGGKQEGRKGKKARQGEIKSQTER